METLPDWIYFNGKTYHLFEEVLGEPVEGWYAFLYAENRDSAPPNVSDGKCGYYLCTTDPDKDVAYNDMLDRINNMKTWLKL